MPLKSAVGEMEIKKENFAFYIFGGNALVPPAVSINTESKNHGLIKLTLH